MNFKCSPPGHLSCFLNFLNSNQVAENVILVHPFFEERVYLQSFKMYLQVECACLPLVNANMFPKECFKCEEILDVGYHADRETRLRSKQESLSKHKNTFFRVSQLGIKLFSSYNIMINLWVCVTTLTNKSTIILN